MPELELVMDKSNTEYDVINSKGLIHSHQPPLITAIKDKILLCKLTLAYITKILP